jgi:AbrB family looped-hinge helix DNA binding protein
MKTVKVTAKGQITLPAALREELNIKEGSHLDASIFLDGILLKPVRDGHELVREYCEKYGSVQTEDSVEEAKKILKKVPFSLSERSVELREEQP